MSAPEHSKLESFQVADPIYNDATREEKRR